MKRAKNRDTGTPSAREKRSRGRPPKYNPDFHPQAAKKFCEMGATINQLADAFGVTIGSIYQWINTYSEFNESCEVGRERAEKRLERSLYERGVGFYYDAEKPLVVGDKIKKVSYRQYMPPAEGANKFLLAKYNPEKWSEKSRPDGQNQNPLVALLVDIKANITFPEPTEQAALPATTTIEHEPPEQEE